METTKTISTGYLLQQVQSRFKINNSNWRADAIDNIGLIVNEIGYHIGYEEEKINLKVENYKVQIPARVVTIGTRIKYNRSYLVCVSNRDDFQGYKVREGEIQVANNQQVLELDKQTKRLDDLKTIYASNPTEQVLIEIQDSLRKIGLLVEGVTYNNYANDCRFPWYKIENGYIKTSFETGYIEIDADVFCVDEKGLPMVVDTFKYREACIWGILYYMMLGGYIHPVINLQTATDEKDKFVMQAQNEPKQLSIIRHQEFAEEWSTIRRGVSNETLNNL